ncbi:MAG: FtsX-like permease family protein, partial [Thiovulaceae bacterium]|nr:FtsX-like permease family protein [Sulfurimonadaceae bacterium]
AQIASVDNVKVVAPKIVNEGLMATAASSRFVRITGVDLESEKRFGHLDEFIISGEYSFGKKDKRVIIGSKLAEDLELRVGKKLVIQTQDSEGEIASIGARISGIVKTDNPVIDALTVFVSQSQVEKLFGTPDVMTTMAVRINDESRILETVEKIQTLLPKDVKAYSWQQYFPLLVQIETTYKSFGTIAYMIVFAIVAIGIFNIILVSVLERLKEYGIMMAIGTPFRNIRFQIIIESLILSGIGLIIGLILGSLLLLYYSEVGITYGDAGKSMSAWGMGTVIYTNWSFEYVTAAINAVVIATLISVWMPIRILKKRNPMTVLHFA